MNQDHGDFAYVNSLKFVSVDDTSRSFIKIENVGHV